MTTKADHKKCISNPPSQAIKDFGSKDPDLNFLNHRGHAEQGPHFVANDFRGGEVTAPLPATE